MIHPIIKTIRIVGILYILYFPKSLFGQEIEQLKETPFLKTSGGLSVTSMYTSTNDPNNQRDPFFWQLQANLNFKLFGLIDAPFSASFNNQKSSFTQPALPSQFGISPNYKMYTAHLGWRSMNLSKYTLGGQTFLGGGVEINPENYWLSGKAMYGRIQNNVQPIRGQSPGAYRRFGYGMQLKAGKTDFISITAFRARDDETSIVIDSLAGDVAPMENLSWSVSGQKNIGENFSFNGEIAGSALTKDTRNTVYTLDNYNYYNNVGKLFTPNATTQFRNAMEFGFNWNLGFAALNGGYNRVDPDYESLGVQGVNNDLEQYKIGIAWQMFNSKVSVATTGGLQRNNLDNSLSKGVAKYAGSANINWMAMEGLSFNLTYSNFTTQSLSRRTPNLQTVDIQLDTLEFFQVTENTGFNVAYQFGKRNLKHGVNLTTNLQNANDSENNNNNAFNGNLMYNMSIPNIKLIVATAYNYNKTTTNAMEFLAYGPTISVAKPIIKDAVNLSIAYTRLTSEQSGNESIISNLVFNARYSHKKKHNFTVSAISSSRDSGDESVGVITENRVNFQYAFSF